MQLEWWNSTGYSYLLPSSWSKTRNKLLSSILICDVLERLQPNNPRSGASMAIPKILKVARSPPQVNPQSTVNKVRKGGLHLHSSHARANFL